MKILTTSLFIIFTLVINAQFLSPEVPSSSSTTVIRASDPTQLYTTISINGGINFIDNEPDNWEFGFSGAIAIKEKLQFSFFAPITNKSLESSLFSNVHLNAAYQLHNNSGIYNSSIITFGLKTPIFDDFLLNGINESVSSTSYELSMGYTGGVRLNKKLTLFPHVEYYRKSVLMRGTFFDQSTGALVSFPNIQHNGWRTQLTLSADFNEKNFIQLIGNYNFGQYSNEPTSESLINYNRFTSNQFLLKVRYQHAFTPSSQLFIEAFKGINEINNSQNVFRENLSGFKVGYLYFIKQ